MSNKKIIIYYALLIFVLVSWKNDTTAPPMALRLFFYLAVLAPGFTKISAIIPAAIICFWGTTSNGYAYSYMPTGDYVYTFSLIPIYLFLKKSFNPIKIPKINILYLFFVYTFIINIIFDFTICSLSYTILIVLMFIGLIDDNDKKSIDIIALAYMMLSIIVSFYALSMRNQIALDAVAGDINSERLNWVDPNYLGMQVAIGALIGLSKLSQFSNISSFYKTVSIVSVVISIPAILMTGSRGAALCLAGAGVFYLLTSSLKYYYKLLIVAALVGFALILYGNGFFDLLIARTEGDDGTGSDRSLIWARKINCYLEGNPFNILFGFGNRSALTLGSNEVIGFHNDFLSMLCSYGIVGFILFVNLLFWPYRVYNKHAKGRLEILAFTVFLILALLTLEPMSSGLIAFYSLLLYMLLLSKFSWNE